MPLFGNKKEPEPEPKRNSSIFSRNKSPEPEPTPKSSSIFSTKRTNSDDAVLDKDASVSTARQLLKDAEKAEKEADKALIAARVAVREAREHCKRLEASALAEMKAAKAKHGIAKGLRGNAEKDLGKHGS